MKRQQNFLKPSWKGKKLSPGKQRNCKISQYCNKRLSLSTLSPLFLPPSSPPPHPPSSPPPPRVYRSSPLVWGGVGGEVRIYSSLQLSQCALLIRLIFTVVLWVPVPNALPLNTSLCCIDGFYTVVCIQPVHDLTINVRSLCCFSATIREYWMIYRGPGFLAVVSFGPPCPTPPPPLSLPLASCLSFSVFLCVADQAFWVRGWEGVGEEPNHATTVKLALC